MIGLLVLYGTGSAFGADESAAGVLQPVVQPVVQVEQTVCGT